MPVKKRTTLTKYQKLVKAKKRHCEGKIKASDFNKVAKVYVDDAVKKGNKTKKQAEAVVNKLKRKACATAAKKTVTKKKKKTTTRRRRA